MPGNLHIMMADPIIHKKVLTRRWTVGAARAEAITEMKSHLHLSFPDTPHMPAANDVKIFREQFQTTQPTTLIRNLHPNENSDYLAFIPPPTNISIGNVLSKLSNDIEQLRKQSEDKMSALEQKQVQYEQQLADLQAQQADTLSWMVIGDNGSLDRIMLRNLLDKAQTVVGSACGLTNHQEPSSWDWRSQFTGIRPEDRPLKAMTLLRHSSLESSTVRQLCASQQVLSILSEQSEIRKEGDKLAHDNLINKKRYTLAIECQSDPERTQALKLLLDMVKGYK